MTNTITPADDDIVLPSTAVQVVQDTILKRFQATITNNVDRQRKEDAGLKNIIVDAAAMNRDAAYDAVKDYLMAKFAEPITRRIFLGLLEGEKPKHRRVSPSKYEFSFSHAGEELNVYTVQLIEV